MVAETKQPSKTTIWGQGRQEMVAEKPSDQQDTTILRCEKPRKAPREAKVRAARAPKPKCLRKANAMDIHNLQLVWIRISMARPAGHANNSPRACFGLSQGRISTHVDF